MKLDLLVDLVGDDVASQERPQPMPEQSVNLHG
jgi:hypothetical protein